MKLLILTSLMFNNCNMMDNLIPDRRSILLPATEMSTIIENEHFFLKKTDFILDQTQNLHERFMNAKKQVSSL